MFLPNKKISEIELSKEMGISRTTTRKALLLLEERGMLKHVPGYGMVVLDAGGGGAYPFVVLQALCYTAAHLAGGRASAEDRRRLLDIHHSLCVSWRVRERTETGFTARQLLDDRAFHALIADLSANLALKESIAQLFESGQEAAEMFFETEARTHQKVHEEMLDLLGIERENER